MQISALSTSAALAIAIIGLMVVIVQAYSKWLELQTARINKDIAKSKNEAADKQIESQSQRRSGSAAGSNRWVLRYFWQNQKSLIVIWFLLFSGPLIWGNLRYIDGPPPAVFIWTVGYVAPLSYLLGYFILTQMGEAYLADRMVEREKERAAQEAKPAK